MAIIAHTNVTVTVTQQKKVNGSPTRRNNAVTIAFGNGSLTYPTGGVEMPAGGSFGMPNKVVEAIIVDDHSAGLGYNYTYDKANNKLMMRQGDNNNASDAPLIELVTSVTPAAISLKCTAIGY